ncbi:transcription factor Tfb2 [Mycena rebaudengoi]|nr:transcription factor Tfb2 [Mycena rebaudengoi]
MPSIQASTQAEAVNSPHSLLPFLQSQSQTTLTRLYQRPSSCLSIFRLLEPLQQQIVMNLLWLESAITSSTMAALGCSTINTRPMGIDGLDGYALERWEVTILHYMVSSGTGQNSMRPSADVLYLLQRSGLMAMVRFKSHLAGFQFLLHSPHAQLWDLLLQYLRMAEERGMDLVEVLSFLFMLSTMELGREYSTEGMNVTSRDYGLLWQRKPSSRPFLPPRVWRPHLHLLPLRFPTSTGPSSGPKEGFIVLETNYRIYAYTDNPLQTAVLNLFVALKYRFPNLVVGSITRDSVKKALSNGISAETAHAHPQMRKHNPLLPVTVQDQIRLWELEKNRLKSQEGYLYTAFTSPADYELVLNYAKQLDVVLWENAAKRCFFGSLDGHPNIKGFIERRTGANA